MPILIHNNPEYLEALKAKRIADKQLKKQLRVWDYVNSGLVVKYRNGSNTRTY